ncbi:hypothetical protein [Paraburkholderia tropica]|uniref:hypothetical protein n=1 Tax=Paraburkholderia tropica TaxID=92647 RepID=UPI00161C8EA7|nr:hypothetical protein [Paraburkholderia tropica]MBB6319282.1 tetratricopeptide (TPR) repeat protein [Paraburkholderia tropica]
MNQPAKAAMEGLNELFVLVAHGENDVLTVKRHERQARLLLERQAIAPAFAWLAIGAAAFLQGKRSDSKDAIKAAIRLAPKDEAVLGNASSLFALMGEASLAVQTARQLIETGIDGHGLLGALSTLKKALQLEEAFMIAEKRNAKFDPALAASAARLLEIAAEHAVGPAQRIKMIEVAAAAVFSQGSAIRQASLRHLGGELRFEFYVDESAARCGELNFAIADALCDSFDDPAPEFVTFACRPVSSYHFDGDFIQVKR